MFSLLKKYWKPLAILLLTAFSFLRTYRAGYDSADAEWQRKWAERDAKAAEALVQQQAAVRVAEQRQQRDVAAIDAKYTQELADARAENDRLSAKLANGGRVRVTGECKAVSTTTGSVGNAGTVELSPVAGSNVLSIRAAIISDQQKIKYLQDYIRKIQK